MQIEEEVREFIVENFLFGQDDQALSDDDSLLDNGVIDSTGVLELIAFLEDRYQITVEDMELVPENLDSVSRLAGFIQRKQQS
jgi:acyl carrier protein